MRESDSAVLIALTAEQMHSLGVSLGRALRSIRGGAVVIALAGELGAGKTTLVRGVLSAMGVRGAVRSPTYTLIEPYELSERTLYHLDLYRLVDSMELENLGIRDLLHADAVLLIEWAERGGGAAPSADLRIALEYAQDPPGARRVVMEPLTPVGHRLLLSWRSVKHQQNELSP